MRYLFTFFLCVLCFTVFSKDMPHTSWGEGCIIFNSTKKIVGKVGYDYVNDLVLYQDGKLIKTYTPRQVDYFQIISKDSKKFYQYVSLAYAFYLSYEREAFFEVILDGLLAFLRKPNKRAFNMGITPSKGREEPGAFLRIDKLCFDYFYCYQDKIQRIYNFHKDVMPILSDQKEMLNDYIEENDILDFTPRNQMVIIHYYNLLTATAREEKQMPVENWKEYNIME